MFKLYERDFKPQTGDIYYTPCFINMYEKRTWRNYIEDYINYYRGLVFKTEDEAIKITLKMLEASRN